jgi:hypothetical protein
MPLGPLHAWTALFCSLTTACGVDAAPAAEPVMEEERAAQLRRRAAAAFEQAVFLKPFMEGDSGLDPYLAPLFYVEGRSEGVHPERHVFFREEPAALGPSAGTCRTFVWQAAGGFQGLRCWYDGDGQPLAYAILRDTSGAQVLWVHKHREKAAEERFGKPLPGAAFSSEVVPAGDTVVVGLVDDGPVPTGPFLYEDPASGDILALHCRCQSSRVGEVLETLEYELVRTHAGPSAEPPGNAFAGWWDERPLERLLR